MEGNVQFMWKGLYNVSIYYYFNFKMKILQYILLCALDNKQYHIFIFIYIYVYYLLIFIFTLYFLIVIIVMMIMQAQIHDGRLFK